MLKLDANVQEEFGRENVTRPLVSLLGMDVDLEEFKEVKLMLKESCTIALWKLAKGSLSNSRKITETKALLMLAKIIEKEEGELKRNCLMVVMELAAVAESNADLKRAAFKPSTTAAKFIFDQLLRVINKDTTVPFVIPAVKAICCLASMFPAKEKRIVQSLVPQLGHRNLIVATAAAKVLGKCVCNDNYNSKEHSQAMIEFNSVQKLMSLLRSNKRAAVAFA